MNYVKNLRFFLSACLLAMAVLFSGVAQAHEEEKKPYVPRKVDIYEGFPDWYKGVFADNVGLKEGSGLFKDHYKPPFMHMYMYPGRHYEPPTRFDHSIFIEKERRDLCIRCHETINTGAIEDWKTSAHYNPRKTPIIARKTKIIEDSIGKEISVVDCFDCHVDTEKKQIRLPTAGDCSECHARQVTE